MRDLRVTFFRTLIVLLSKFPLKFHYFMGDILAWFARNIFRYRSDVVYVNIARSFPEKKYKAVKKIYDDFYRHFGEIVAETIWFGGSDSRRLKQSGIVTVMNRDEIVDIFNSSPSMTVLCSHCGNWEIIGGILDYESPSGESLPFKESEVSVVYKKLSNKVSDEVFILNRTAPLGENGLECAVESRNVLRYAIRNRNSRHIYIYPTDQAPYWKTGKYPIGKFLSQDTYAMFGGAGVACKLSHSVMYMKMKQVERGRYELSMIPICLDASAMTPEQITRKYYDLLEEEIRETPYNWLWSHKRWK
ncbi:MAG: lysophospholipid acyltransferase family protein [Bacteroidales bacterium]|nr:lysophospholipid acyltransferase family protein [Bacteroidales bacterium]